MAKTSFGLIIRIIYKPYNSNSKNDGRNAKSLAIDSSGSNLYLHRGGRLKRYEIQASSCPKTSRSSNISTSGTGTSHGFIFKPGSDTVIYMPDYNDEFYKYFKRHFQD